MPRLLIVMLGLGLLLGSNLSAQQPEEEVISAGELAEACQAEAAASFCNTFIVTLVQTVTAMQEAGEGPSLFCINPQVITLDEVRQTILQQLQKMPERAADDGYAVVSEILHQRYPCGAKSF